MEERRSCLGCYSYQYDTYQSKCVCTHEDMDQHIMVNDHRIPVRFVPKTPDEFCCSLWR